MRVLSSAGERGPLLFSSKEHLILFPVTPALDRAGQRLFVPLAGLEGHSIVLGVFDLSKANLGVVTLEKTLPLVGSYFFSVHYDPAGEQVLLVATDLKATSAAKEGLNDVVGIWVEAVDLKSGTAKKLSTLPDDLVLAVGNIGGAPVAFDEKFRLLALPTRKAQKTQSTDEIYWSQFYLLTQKWSSQQLTSFLPVALHGSGASTFALLNPVSAPSGQSPLSFGTIEVPTGKVSIISKWNSTEFVFAVGSMAAYDEDSAHFYSVMGTGTNTHVALVSVSTKSGQAEASPFFASSQPSGLTCF